MNETLEQRLQRIRKYGMKNEEVFDPSETSQILMAQIQYLNWKCEVMEEALDIISSDYQSLGYADFAIINIAKQALEEISVRTWKK